MVNRMLGALGSKKSIPQGAATTVWGALAPEAGSAANRGAYLFDCAPQQPASQCQDMAGTLREELWVATETQLAEAVKAAGLE
jgi:hypothetical protein